MQQSKAEDRYSCETLLSMNTLYDHEHHLTQADVDAANKLWCVISNVPATHVSRRSATGCAIPRATVTSTATP
ncbi:hypothetical protein [Alistipes putredinis]|uniref:hypothetical protein n=1 Tax=Alistipes putredinis TaxID=28117 RepID=UPI0039909D21